MEMPEVQVGSVGKACGLVGDPEVVSVVEQTLGNLPETPTSSSKPLAEPVQREPLIEEGDPSGELGRGSKGWFPRSAGEVRVFGTFICLVLSRGMWFQ